MRKAPGLAPRPAPIPIARGAPAPSRSRGADRRVALTSVIALLIGLAAAPIAEALRALIALVTNLSFYGRWSFQATSPTTAHLGPWVVLPPVVGGLIVGLMARYGSAAIRGHGIPEVMEQVLLNRSRIAPRLTVLKPLSAAIAIGTGGPFGAEGPIIATGGALGSLVGQLVAITAAERKVLLAAGAAAGMTATFGTPVSAVLLAVEFLLFEFRAQSLIPVALASVGATAVRMAFRGSAPMFAMPALAEPGALAIAACVGLGAAMGLAGVFVTRAVYGVEDLFERLPVHWMWWPAIGGIAVGAIGFIDPATMGVGYDNITRVLTTVLPWRPLLLLGVLKFVSWVVALGSGTSGGTLAPLFTIGGALGALGGAVVAALLPHAGLDPRLAALVGMAALFTGASHAMLTWVVFAFETTRQSAGLLPLLGACAAAYLVSMLRMETSIMTEKIVRRGTPVLGSYEVDHLRRHLVRHWSSAPVATLAASEPVAGARQRLDRDAGLRHQGFPVLDRAGRLVGVLTRRNLFDPAAAADATVGELVRRPARAALTTWSLRQAADEMVRESVGRLPVVEPSNPAKVVGIITRSDLLRAHAGRLDEIDRREPSLVTVWRLKRARRRADSTPAP